MCLLLIINMEDRSVALVLHNAVADGKSEECVALFGHMGLGVRRAVLAHFADLLHFFGGFELRELLTFFNLSELQELVESCLSDRDDLLDHVPEDALREGCRRQGALVSPSAVVVEQSHKLGQVQLSAAARVLLIYHLAQELVVEVGGAGLLEVTVIHGLEEEAEHSVRELRSFGPVISVCVKLVDDMHLQIFQLAVDRVLRWCMEVGLQAVEVRHLDLFVEKINRLGRQHIVS